jgi:hypothetical protein
MKKALLIILACTTLLPAGKAQSDSTLYSFSFANSPWSIGIQAGMNIASAYSTEGEVFKVEPKVGLAIAVFADIPLGKYILLRPEVHLSQRSVQASGLLFAENYNLKRTTTYLDVPMLVAFKPTSFFKVMAGPQYSYLLKQRDQFSGEPSQSTRDEFNLDALRTHTISAIIGFEITKKQFTFSPRLAFDLLDNRQNETSATPRYRLVYYQFMVGYKFF